MNDKPELLTKATMSEAQRACFELLCDVFHGEHHTPDRIYAFGRGIKCNAESHRLSTFDFDYLTRLVVLAHDRCVRVEIVSSGLNTMLHGARRCATEIWIVTAVVMQQSPRW